MTEEILKIEIIGDPLNGMGIKEIVEDIRKMDIGELTVISLTREGNVVAIGYKKDVLEVEKLASEFLDIEEVIEGFNRVLS